MNKAIILLFAALMACAFVSCSSDDEPNDKTETLNDFNLSDMSSYYGTWIVSEKQKLDGTFAYTDNTEDRAWIITRDTITRQVGVYNFKCPYTFSNGTFTAEDGVLTKYTRVFKFEHYSEYRLKATVTYEGTTFVYLVYKQSNGN